MHIAGIVAEFNPFHRGHAFLIEQARLAGASHVVAVMSGNFVQRGVPAVAEKRLRTRCALENGADLVLELPLPYATATAGRFALGAVGVLCAAGCVELLCFGSECGEAGPLERLAVALESTEVYEAAREYLDRGDTFARARQKAVEKLLGPEPAGLLASPNNLLAVEYLRAALRLEWEPALFTVARQGVRHDAVKPSGGYASASYLRALARRFDRLERYMPPSAVALLRQAGDEGMYPADMHRLERAVLAHLRRQEPEALALLPDLSEGLENRLYQAIRQARSLEELYALLKTKRYTLARVRRLVLHAFLGVAAADTETPPPYLRVLGIGRRGGEMLGRMGKTALLPVDTRLARLREQGPQAARFALLEERSTDLYTLALPTPQPCGYELRAGGVYLK